MNPFKKLWMYYNWIEDQNDKVELVKNHAYLLASFDHPDRVKKMTGEGTQQHTSTDKEFELASQMVLQDRERNTDPQKVKRKRKKKQIKG